MIIKLKPIPFSKVWGGSKLSIMYDMKELNIGEIWGISAHKSYSNYVLNKEFKGITFRDFYCKHREYFGYLPKDEFPLLFKIIDAAGDLSIQVHPEDKYALEHEKSYGKDECWYILDSKDDTKIVIGHKAQTKKEILDAISENRLEDLLSYYKVNKDDYFYIPSGKIHAICKDTTLFEVSQSSDITYRLYDYNRLDNGELRTLHIDKSLDVITVPDTEIQKKHNDKIFSFDIIEVNNMNRESDIYGDYIYVIQGDGFANKEPISKGEFFMVTSKFKYTLTGNLKITIVNIKN